MTYDIGRRERSVEKASAPLGASLRIATFVTLIAALIGSAGGAVGKVAGTVAIVVVVATPVARVLFLSVQWLRSGDRRFAFAAAVLLAVLVGGAMLAAFGR